MKFGLRFLPLCLRRRTLHDAAACKQIHAFQAPSGAPEIHVVGAAEWGGPPQEPGVVHPVVGFLAANECGRLFDRKSAHGGRGVQGLGQLVQVASAGGRDACFEVNEFAVSPVFRSVKRDVGGPFWANTSRMWSVTSCCSTRSLSVQATDGFLRVPARDTVSTSCCWARNKSSGVAPHHVPSSGWCIK